MPETRNPGDRVLLASPYGKLTRGVEGCSLLIGNGNPGTVVGASDAKSVVVHFDLLGGAVGVVVPEHWLAPWR